MNLVVVKAVHEVFWEKDLQAGFFFPHDMKSLVAFLLGETKILKTLTVAKYV